MEFSEIISSRRSIRKFKSDAISPEKLEKLKAALLIAPTGSNKQPFKFIFVTDASLRKELVLKACHQPGFADAPLIVVACAQKGSSFDTAIAVDHLILAATDAGLGSCWVGWIEREEIRLLLNIPAEIEIPVIVPIGYADEAPDARPRKPLSDLIIQNTYS
jgi:nitroreductase